MAIRRPWLHRTHRGRDAPPGRGSPDLGLFHLVWPGRPLMLPLPIGNGVSFSPLRAMLTTLSDYCDCPGTLHSPWRPRASKAPGHQPLLHRMRNPVTSGRRPSPRGWNLPTGGDGNGPERPSVHAVVPVMMLTTDTGVPDPGFIVDLAKKYPQKPILVTFSGDKACMDQYKEAIEPRGIPTFPNDRGAFRGLSILARCRQA